MRNYEDIIKLPRHVSATRKQMPMEERAAQFSPFAALTGFDAAIKETSRQTEERIYLSEDALAELDYKLQVVLENISSLPEIEVMFFLPDARKNGGAYICRKGRAAGLDERGRKLVFSDGKAIPLDDILEINSELFGTSF